MKAMTVFAVLGVAVGVLLWVREYRRPPVDDNRQIIYHLQRHYPETDGRDSFARAFGRATGQ